MIEPPVAPSAGIAGIFVALLGPVFGPFAVVLWAALAGAMWPLSKRATHTKLDGAVFLIRVALTSTVVTVPLAILVEMKLGVPMAHASGLVAFGVGMAGDDWPKIGKAVARFAFARYTGASKEPKE
jgi:hypothetical protein